MSLCAFAADEETEVTGPSPLSASMPVKGTVKEPGVILLSVVVPTALTFDIETTESSDELYDVETGSTITGGAVFATYNAGNGTLTNNTKNHDVKVEITDVAETSGYKLLKKVQMFLNADGNEHQLEEEMGSNIVLVENLSRDGGELRLYMVAKELKNGANQIKLEQNDNITLTVTLKVSVNDVVDGD